MKYVVFAIVVFSTVSVRAQTWTNSITLNGETTYIHTSCVGNSCRSTITSYKNPTYEQLARAAAIKRACKDYRTMFGKNLETFPGPFADYDVSTCISKDKYRSWIIDRNYNAYLVDNKVHVTMPEDYQTYLRSQGYKSKLLP